MPERAPQDPSPEVVAMYSGRSITRLITQLKHGEAATTQAIWGEYFSRLVGQARARLRAGARTRDDEEDVALSAFGSFFRRAERGRFPHLQNRNDLWQILFVLTVRKAVNHAKHEGWQIRGGGARPYP